MSGFSLSPANVGLSVLGFVTVGTTLCCRLKVPEPWGTLIGCLLALVTGIYTLHTLIRLVGMDNINRYLQKFGLSFPFHKPEGPTK